MEKFMYGFKKITAHMIEGCKDWCWHLQAAPELEAAAQAELTIGFVSLELWTEFTLKLGDHSL